MNYIFERFYRFSEKADGVSENAINVVILKRITGRNNAGKEKNCRPETKIVYNSVYNSFIEE